MPSIRHLASSYGIAPQTVQNALRELRQAGLIVSQQGRAFFVRDPARPTALTDGDRLARLESQVRELRDRVAKLEAER